MEKVIEKGKFHIIEYTTLNGLKHGWYKHFYFYDCSKLLKYECHYQLGEKDGLERECNVYERYWKNDKLHGLEIMNHGNSIIKTNYKNGERDGFEEEWIKGKLSYRHNYKNNLMDGLQQGWYQNRILKYESFYNNGERNGVAKYYDEDGFLNNEKIFDNGIKQIERRYNKDGSIHSELTRKQFYKNIDAICSKFQNIEFIPIF